jgi:hypothetical protein
MKLLIMQLSSPSRHSITLWSKYSPEIKRRLNSGNTCLLSTCLLNVLSRFLAGAETSNFSDVTLNHNQKPTESLSARPYIDFYNRHLARRTKDLTDGSDVSTHQLDPSTSVAGNRGDKESSVKDMEVALKVEAALILRWKVIQ